MFFAKFRSDPDGSRPRLAGLHPGGPCRSSGGSPGVGLKPYPHRYGPGWLIIWPPGPRAQKCARVFPKIWPDPAGSGSKWGGCHPRGPRGSSTVPGGAGIKPAPPHFWVQWPPREHRTQERENAPQDFVKFRPCPKGSGQELACSPSRGPRGSSY